MYVCYVFFFSSRRRHTRLQGDWSSDVCSSDLSGETVALLGPSGVGKSVLLKHIIGLIKPDSGEVWVDGQLVPTLGRKELAALRSRIGYVFQNGALFDSMDVFDNIRLGITDEDLYGDKEYCVQRVKECLRLVEPPQGIRSKLASAV